MVSVNPFSLHLHEIKIPTQKVGWWENNSETRQSCGRVSSSDSQLLSFVMQQSFAGEREAWGLGQMKKKKKNKRLIWALQGGERGRGP